MKWGDPQICHLQEELTILERVPRELLGDLRPYVDDLRRCKDKGFVTDLDLELMYHEQKLKESA